MMCWRQVVFSSVSLAAIAVALCSMGGGADAHSTPQPAEAEPQSLCIKAACDGSCQSKQGICCHNACFCCQGGKCPTCG